MSKSRQGLDDFLDYCALMEKNNKTCPPVPKWLEIKFPFPEGPFEFHERHDVEKKRKRKDKETDNA